MHHEDRCPSSEAVAYPAEFQLAHPERAPRAYPNQPVAHLRIGHHGLLQNDKLIYIAPPILEGIRARSAGCAPLLSWSTKSSDFLILPDKINTLEQNRELVHTRIRDLRNKNGLPSHRLYTRMYTQGHRSHVQARGRPRSRGSSTTTGSCT